MKRVSKIIFISSVAFIVLCCLIHILIKNSNFEFIDAVDWFDDFLIFGVPIAILLTLFRIDYSSNSQEIDIVETVSTITIMALAVFVFLYFFLSYLFDFCGTDYEQAIYRSKETPSLQIVERSFGCGAIDSGPPNISLYEIERYRLGLIYVKPIDTSRIDLKLWDRVD
ncbi:MAG: hypothetical protein HRT58_20110 [Crocinitomicaceae bacterium]|nr:hypothetical protein [Flavobacteriales bacterium]NQZ37975.1 hypothetical protein [Crocinitomicaceae bacterium]